MHIAAERRVGTRIRCVRTSDFSLEI